MSAMSWALDRKELSNLFRNGVQLSHSERELLSAAIEATQERVEELLLEIDNLRSTIAFQQSALSPIRCLPIEILARIFTFASLEGMALEYDDRKPPWNIGAVCKHWRNVLYSTQHPWRAISIDWKWMDYGDDRWDYKVILKRHYASGESDHGIHPTAARVNNFLELSGGHPLSIDSPFPFQSITIGPMDTIIERMERLGWRSTFFQLENNAFSRWTGGVRTSFLKQLTVLDEGSTLTLPMITRLTGVHEWFIRDLMDGGITVKLPKLRAIVLDDIWYTPSHVPDISQRAELFLVEHRKTLRTLDFRGWHDFTGLAFCLRCPSSIDILSTVECLKFRSLSGSPIPSQQPPTANEPHPIFIPHIRYLSISSYPFQTSVYLRSMAIPTLKILQIVISPFTPHNERVESALLEFFDASSCQRNLESLCLSGLVPEALPPVLNRLDNLRELVLYRLPGTVKEALGSPSSGKLILPALKRLTILDNTDLPVDPSDLVDILKTRNPNARVFSFKSFRRTWAFVDGHSISIFDDDSLAFEYRSLGLPDQLDSDAHLFWLDD